MSIEQMYKSYTPLIKARAAHWQKPGRIGLEYEDLISIGNEVFLSCYDEWNQHQGTFGTFLKSSLNMAFYNECVVKPNRICYTSPINNHQQIESFASDNHSPESYTIFKNELETLSPAAKKIVNKTLEVSPAMMDHMVEETGNACVSKRRITRYLTEVESWPINQIQTGLKEIKCLFASEY